jgi:hypothetical protein
VTPRRLGRIEQLDQVMLVLAVRRPARHLIQVDESVEQDHVLDYGRYEQLQLHIRVKVPLQVEILCVVVVDFFVR